jgi:hypothetical protein
MSFYGYNPADYRADLSMFSKAFDKFGGALAMIPEINKERTDMMSNANYMKSAYDDTLNSFNVLADNTDILRQYAKITQGESFDEAGLENEVVKTRLKQEFLNQLQSKLTAPEAYDRRGKGASLDGEVNTKSGIRGNSVFATGEMNKAYTMRLAQGMSEALTPYRELMIEKGLLSQMATAASNHLGFTPKEFQGANDNLDYRRLISGETAKGFNDVLNSDNTMNLEKLGSFNDTLKKLEEEKAPPASIERFKKEYYDKYMSKATAATFKTVEETTAKIRNDLFNAENTISMMTNPASVFRLMSERMNESKEELLNNKVLQDNPTLMQYAMNELDGKMKYDLEILKFFSSGTQSMMAKSRTGGTGGGKGEAVPKIPTAYLEGYRSSIATTLSELKDNLKNADPKDKGDIEVQIYNTKMFQTRLNALTDLLSNQQEQFTPAHTVPLLESSFADIMMGLKGNPELIKTNKINDAHDMASYATKNLKIILPSASVVYDNGVFTIVDALTGINAPLNFNVEEVLPGRKEKTQAEKDKEKATREQQKATNLVSNVGEKQGEATTPIVSGIKGAVQGVGDFVGGGVDLIDKAIGYADDAVIKFVDGARRHLSDMFEKDPKKRGKFIPPTVKEMNEKELADYIKNLRERGFKPNKHDMQYLFRRENDKYIYNGDI